MQQLIFWDRIVSLRVEKENANPVAIIISENNELYKYSSRYFKNTHSHRFILADLLDACPV